MSDDSGTAASLRAAFDRSFAEPPRGPSAAADPAIELRIGGDRYALRLAEVVAIHAGRRVVPVPGPLPELLGLTAFRGRVAAVWDLAAILGYPGVKSSRWLVLVGAVEPVALAIGSVERYLGLPADTDPPDTSPGRPHIGRVARDPAGALPVVDLPSVLAELGRRARPADPHKER